MCYTKRRREAHQLGSAPHPHAAPAYTRLALALTTAPTMFKNTRGKTLLFSGKINVNFGKTYSHIGLAPKFGAKPHQLLLRKSYPPIPFWFFFDSFLFLRDRCLACGGSDLVRGGACVLSNIRCTRVRGKMTSEEKVQKTNKKL